MKNYQFATNINRVNKLFISGALLLAASLATSSAFAADAAADKTINVRSTNSAQAEDLDVKFETLGSSYAVNESIRFRIKGNKTFFLYLYSVDDKGDAVLILPNKYQTAEQNKYTGGSQFTVPNRNVEFYADEAGTERVMIVASTKYIDVKTSSMKAFGDFYKTKATNLEKIFEAKGGIRIRSAQRRAINVSTPGMVVKDIELQIHGKSNASSTQSNTTTMSAAATFITTAKDNYKLGDRFDVAFGADRVGTVSLFVIEPGGSPSKLKNVKVDGKKIYKVKLRAESPQGRHMLVAIYTKDGRVDQSVLNGLDASNYKSKALVLDSDDSSVIATREIRIYR